MYNIKYVAGSRDLREVKAALVSEPKVISVVDLPAPEPQPGQVIVGVEATSICGSDLNGFLGVNPRNRLPNILGHEIAGTVVAVGDGVTLGMIGQRVVVEPNVSCRTCEWCLAGLPNVCDDYRVLGESMDVPGGLAEFVGVSADQVYPLPAHVPSADGAIIQPLSVCYHAVVNRAQVTEGETVLVLGAGAIGLGCLLLAKWRGARVIVTDISDGRLELARRLGADETLAADEAEIGPAVRELTNGRGADATMEAVGGGQDRTIADAVAATSTRGRIVIVGTFGKLPQRISGYFFKNHEQTMMGSHGHPNAFAPTIELVANGSIKPGDLITHRFPLADVAEAFRLLGERADGVVKVVVEQ
jgi:threonine dehydrogenase-like Zn-dependent dehydrogenase